MTTYTLTQEQVDNAVELLVTSLHHIPLDDPDLMADTQVMINKLRSLISNNGEMAAPSASPEMSDDLHIAYMAGYNSGKLAAPRTNPENYDAEENVRLDAELQRCMKEHDALRTKLATQTRVADTYRRLMCEADHAPETNFGNIPQAATSISQPLTENYIIDIASTCKGGRWSNIEFARAIEAAHGIALPPPAK